MTTDYRCFLYHATHTPRIFETPAEIEAAVASGWADSPAAAIAVTEERVPAPEAPTPDKSIRGQAPRHKKAVAE